jgi:hypothetical protein
MSKYWIALNIILLMAAGSLGWQLHLGIDRYNNQNDLSKIVPLHDLKQSSAQEGIAAPKKQSQRISAADFSVIPEKNVFSPLRAREAKVDSVDVPEIPPLTQKPILVGITIVGNQRMASIIDPVRQTSGIRKSQIKKLGDMYQGYTITDITADQMVLEAGAHKEIIPLHLGTKKSAQAGKTPVLATRVISIGAGASSTGTTGTVASLASGGAARSSGGSVAQTTAASSGRGARTSGPSASLAATSSGQSSQSGSRSTTTAAQPGAPAVQSQPSTGTSGTSGSGTQGRRVIRTPFGDVVAPETP